VRLGTVISLPLLHDNAEKDREKGRVATLVEQRNDVQCPADSSRVSEHPSVVSRVKSRVEFES